MNISIYSTEAEFEAMSDLCLLALNTTAVILHHDSLHILSTRKLTGEEILGSQVADAQAEDGEFVQTGGDLFRERQQAGQPLQLPIQTVSVPFGRVGLGPIGRWLLHPDEHIIIWRKRSHQTNSHQQHISRVLDQDFLEISLCIC